MKLKYLMKLKKFIPICFLFIGTLALPYPSLAEEKIEVIPIIQSSKGVVSVVGMPTTINK